MKPIHLLHAAPALLTLALLGCGYGSASDQDSAGAAQQPSQAEEEARVERAIARLAPVGGSGVTGSVEFAREGEAVRVTGQLTGLTPGQHGFHVHEFGDLSDLETGQSVGDHYGPEDRPHGKPSAEERHVGDLGNIEADANGVARIDLRDTVLALNGAHSIVGRAIVVHAEADQFTQPSGDAGGRVAAGVIGIAKPRE